MKLSIIIITYNSVQSLRHALAGALSLCSRFEIEVLVVDDGSTDDTARVMEDLCAEFPHLRYERCQENMGRAGARNVGLQAASGDYVCFLDSDDYVLASAMDAIDEALTHHPDIVIPQRLDYDPESGHRHGSSAVDAIYFGVSRIHDCCQHPAMFEDNFITGKFIRAAFLKEKGIRFEDSRRNAEDILFSTDIFLHAACVRVVPEHFYVYARGGYKGKFSVPKCQDVLANTNRIARLAKDGSAGLEREVLSSKVATILFETFKRADGVLRPEDTIKIYRETLDRDAIAGVGRPRFASPKAQRVLAALQAGNVEDAFRNAR